MSDMPHCLSRALESKMSPTYSDLPSIKEINAFLRIFVSKIVESRAQIWGLKERANFSFRTELKMLKKVVDCTIGVGTCIQ
jgi:hypothetical protein